MNSDDETNQQIDTHSSFLDDCNGLSETIGDVTGAVYGYGAGELGGGPAAEQAVDHFIGNFVNQGWHDVCSVSDDVAKAAPIALDEAQHEITDWGQSIADDASIAWNELGLEIKETEQDLLESGTDWIDSFVSGASDFIGSTNSEPFDDSYSIFGGDNETSIDAGSNWFNIDDVIDEGNINSDNS